MITGQSERTENFRPDPAVPSGSAQLNDYKNSGYDRGHLCPAGDMTFNEQAMSETFYLSNMSPQEPAFKCVQVYAGGREGDRYGHPIQNSELYRIRNSEFDPAKRDRDHRFRYRNRHST